MTAELEARLREAALHIRKLPSASMTGTQRKAFDSILARLAESEARAVADARRLDWLMSAMRGADLYFITGTMSDDAATRRTAIDAAIAQEAKREAGSA